MKYILIILGIVLVGGGIALAYRYNNQNPKGNIVACTMEAKICPDGSSVGRSGPKCEFSPCPVSTTTPPTNSGTTASLNQRIFSNGVYITPLEVISDSRCPQDVQCIWAGELTLKVRLEKGSVSKEVVIKLHTPYDFQGERIVLAYASNKTNSPSDYQFMFERVVSFASNEPGIAQGHIWISPTCPVERNPPDPNCLPKGYQTSITIKKEGSELTVKTIQSDSSGVFKTTLPEGTYVLHATGGQVFPRCNYATVIIETGQTTNADISCDTGIR